MKAPIKSFEITKKMYEYFVEKYRDLDPKLMICEKEDFDNIEKSLKALEIIKEKGLSLIHKKLIISSKNYKEYRQEFQLVNSKLFNYEYFCSQEEFDLLKEILL